jgi:hypothetical protein
MTIATESQRVPLLICPRVIRPPEVSLLGDTWVVVVAIGLAAAIRMTDKAATIVIQAGYKKYVSAYFVAVLCMQAHLLHQTILDNICICTQDGYIVGLSY